MWQVMHHVPKCMSYHKAIAVITRRTHCFQDYIYIMPILLLWYYSTVMVLLWSLHWDLPTYSNIFRTADSSEQNIQISNLHIQPCHKQIFKELHVHVVPDNRGTCFNVKEKQNRTDANLKDTTKQTEENGYSLFQKVFVNQNVATTLMLFQTSLNFRNLYLSMQRQYQFYIQRNFAFDKNFLLLSFSVASKHSRMEITETRPVFIKA